MHWCVQVYAYWSGISLWTAKCLRAWSACWCWKRSSRAPVVQQGQRTPRMPHGVVVKQSLHMLVCFSSAVTLTKPKKQKTKKNTFKAELEQSLTCHSPTVLVKVQAHLSDPQDQSAYKSIYTIDLMYRSLATKTKSTFDSVDVRKWFSEITPLHCFPTFWLILHAWHHPAAGR